MGAPRDEKRMRLVMRLLAEGVTSPKGLAGHVGIRTDAMNVWLGKNGLDAEERAQIAAEGAMHRARLGLGIDPYAELRRAVAAAGSQRAWARMVGVQQQNVCQVLAGKKKIGSSSYGVDPRSERPCL